MPARAFAAILAILLLALPDSVVAQVERRFADYKLDRLPALAADLVRAKVDLIVAMGPNSIAAAAQATRSTPIVMVYSGDPVAPGW